MAYNWHNIVKEEYRGYQIVKKRYAVGGGHTTHFSIYKDKEPISAMCLTSPLACRNCIDTHIMALKETELPMIIS